MKLNHDLLAEAAGLECLDEAQIERLQSYGDLLLDANRKINLISRSVDLPIEITNQIAISLLPLRLAGPGAKDWLDIGSGGGFPVIPLACIRSGVQFTAVEQIAKKAYFIERTAQVLGLSNLSVKAATIESVISEIGQRRFEVVSIKAVAGISETMRWASALLTSQGVVLTYKPEPLLHDHEEIAEKHGFEFMKSLDVKELIDTIDVQIVMYKKS